MAMSLTHGQLARIEHKLATGESRGMKRGVRAKQAEMLEVVETVGSAAAVGFIRGKMEDATTGEWNIPGTGIDWEVVIGGAAVAAGLLNIAGDYDDDAIAIGNGVLAHALGQVFRKYAKTGNFALVAGQSPILGGRVISGDASDAEVNAALSALSGR